MGGDKDAGGGDARDAGRIEAVGGDKKKMGIASIRWHGLALAWTRVFPDWG